MEASIGNVATLNAENPEFFAAVTTPRRHNIPRILLIAITIIIYIISEGVLRPSPGSRVFLHTEEVLAQRYVTAIDPLPQVTAVVWPVVYVFQSAWFLLAIYAIFRKTTTFQSRLDGSHVCIESYLYLHPDVFRPHAFYLFNSAQVVVIVFKFIYDNEILIAKIVAQFLIHLSLLAASYHVCKGIKVFDRDMRHDSGARIVSFLRGSRKFYELGMLRIFFLNGLTLYAAWALLCSMIGLCSFMIYIQHLTVQKDIACILSLALILIHFSIFAVLDNFYLDSYTRYVVAPYIICLVTLIGSAANDFSSKDAIKMETALTLVSCIGFSLVKLARLFTTARGSTVSL